MTRDSCTVWILRHSLFPFFPTSHNVPRHLRKCLNVFELSRNLRASTTTSSSNALDAFRNFLRKLTDRRSIIRLFTCRIGFMLFYSSVATRSNSNVNESWCTVKYCFSEFSSTPLVFILFPTPLGFFFPFESLRVSSFVRFLSMDKSWTMVENVPMLKTCLSCHWYSCREKISKVCLCSRCCRETVYCISGRTVVRCTVFDIGHNWTNVGNSASNVGVDKIFIFQFPVSIKSDLSQYFPKKKPES